MGRLRDIQSLCSRSFESQPSGAAVDYALYRVLHCRPVVARNEELQGNAKQTVVSI